jgi:catechol 2,3-dioxygenase-like lactoylglutathione lyase family enzyme
MTNALADKIVVMRPFLPAKDYAASYAFYEALGFTAVPIGDKLSEMWFGAHNFLLQDFYVKEFAENLMMHLFVKDLDAWWAHIESLKLETRFDVQAPRPPKLEDWGMRLVYVFDPSGVLWHVAADPS